MRWYDPQDKAFTALGEICCADQCCVYPTTSQAICSPHGRFELWNRFFPDARGRWEVLFCGVWQQEFDINRAEIFHRRKGISNHRVGYVQISTVLGRQTIYSTD